MHNRPPPKEARHATEEVPQFSEEALALKFATRHKDEWRFVAKWNKWLRWDGMRWRFDETREVFTLARATCREEAKLNNAKNARAIAIASAKTRAAVVSLASEDRRLAATVEQWDADPWLLNTPGGIVDLRTGEIEPNHPDRYMSQITAVAPDQNCKTPLWDTFLKKVTNDDQDFIDFIQRIGGYTLTGDTREEVLFFFFGPGANGKGVLTGTMAGILGEYHRPAAMELFMATNHPQHSTNMAGLHRSRMISVSELEDGVPWAEARIKAMTGRDVITARFMRGDNFDFYPQFTPWVSGNNKPRLRSVDEAIKRRLILLPFSVIISKIERDPKLKEKLKAEWPGILAWFIQGCLKWQKTGMNPPRIVTEATKEYFSSEDTLRIFIEDCFDVGSLHTETKANIFFRWKQFMETRGERVWTQKALTQALEKLGYASDRLNTDGKQIRVTKGLKLKAGDPEEPKMPKDDPWLKDQPF